MDLVGQNLGQYRVVEPIGAGGMASVFKAYQPGLDRYVAVKVLPAQHALTPGFKERFMIEAKAVAQLSHPNILPIYDVGIDNNISYFAMKYVPGETLRDVMQRPISLEQVCDYIDQLAGALDHAHEKGILHRDIKPVNILVEGEWLLLADFGLAKIVESTQALTATGSSMGTPAYISPEQAVGKPIDHRTDIYSLGIVLYEMVTGQVPYSGETPMGVIFKHVHEPLPLPRQVKPGLPEAVELVILKALAKKPEDRFNSVGALATALREAVEKGTTEITISSLPTADQSPQNIDQTIPHQAGITAPAHNVDDVVEAPVAARRQPPWLWIGLGVVVLFLLGGAIIVMSRGGADQSNTNQQEFISAEADSETPPDNSLADVAETEPNPTATDVVESAAEVTEAADETELPTPTDEPTVAPAVVEATATSPPAATSQPANQSSVPSEGRSFTNVPQLSASAVLGRGPINELTVSPNGEAVAVASSLGIWLYSLPSLEFAGLLENQGSGSETVAWSPNETKLASGNDDGLVQIWDIANKQVLQTLEGHTGPVISVAWSPDGAKLASGSEDALIRIWDVDTGQEVSTLSGHLYEPYGLAWSPDGGQLASASRDTTVRVWDIVSGGELQKLESHLDEVNSIDWSPDGTQLVTSSNDLTIRIWNTVDWQEENILSGHTGWIFNAAWSPDGSQIASGSLDGTIRIWDADSGEELGLLEGHTQPGVIAVWSPTGASQLISGGTDGTIRVWDTGTGQETGQLSDHTSLLRDVAWSPNGAQLAAVGFDGAVRMWDVTTQEEVQTIPAVGQFLLSVSWSPDGRQIATGDSEGVVNVWNVANGQAVHSLTGHADQITQVGWSPDGSQIASASWDGTIRLWDPASGARLRELAGHTDVVNTLSWSPDGNQLASGSDDRVVIIWDADNGAEMHRFEGKTSDDVYQYFLQSSWHQSGQKY